MLVKYLGIPSEIPGNPGTPGTPGSPFIPFRPGRPGSPCGEEPHVIPSSQQIQRTRMEQVAGDSKAHWGLWRAEAMGGCQWEWEHEAALTAPTGT